MAWRSSGWRCATALTLAISPLIALGSPLDAADGSHLSNQKAPWRTVPKSDYSKGLAVPGRGQASEAIGEPPGGAGYRRPTRGASTPPAQPGEHGSAERAAAAEPRRLPLPPPPPLATAPPLATPPLATAPPLAAPPLAAPPHGLPQPIPDPPTTIRRTTAALETPGAEYAQVYSMGDLVQKCAAERECTIEEARQELTRQITLADGRPLAPEDFRFVENNLVLRGDRTVHRQVEARIASIRKLGFQQLAMAVQLVTLPSEQLSQLKLAWSSIARAQQAEPAAEESSEPFATGRLEITQPLKFAIVDDARRGELLAKIRSLPEATTFASPHVELFSGRAARVEVGAKRPYVADVDRGQPEVRAVFEGVRLRLQPTLQGDQVALEFQLVESQVLGVEVSDVQAESGAYQIQLPKVRSLYFDTHLELPLDATLVLTGLSHLRDGREMETIAVVRTTRAADPAGRAPRVRGDNAAAPLRRSSSAADPAAPRPAELRQRPTRPSTVDFLPAETTAPAAPAETAKPAKTAAPAESTRPGPTLLERGLRWLRKPPAAQIDPQAP